MQTWQPAWRAALEHEFGNMQGNQTEGAKSRGGQSKDTARTQSGPSCRSRTISSRSLTSISLMCLSYFNMSPLCRTIFPADPCMAASFSSIKSPQGTTFWSLPCPPDWTGPLSFPTGLHHRLHAFFFAAPDSTRKPVTSFMPVSFHHR